MVLNKEAKKLLQKEGITGVSDPEDYIVVYVESEKDINKVPKTLDGKPTKVIVTGEVRALGVTSLDNPATHQMPFRPAIPGGVSISRYPTFPYYEAGTLGLWMVNQENEPVFLSNYHVLIEGYGLGADIVQPGTLDGGNSKNYVIGQSDMYVKINEPPQHNQVDCAYGIPYKKEYVKYEILNMDKVTPVKYPCGYVELKKGDVVYKSGRTTGLTKGKVIDTNAVMKVTGYPTKTGYAIFEDQYVLTAMSEPGDSGSALFDSQGRLAGLVFAGSDTITLANKINNVRGVLGVDLPTKMQKISIFPWLLLGFLTYELFKFYDIF